MDQALYLSHIACNITTKHKRQIQRVDAMRRRQPMFRQPGNMMEKRLYRGLRDGTGELDELGILSLFWHRTFQLARLV